MNNGKLQESNLNFKIRKMKRTNFANISIQNRLSDAEYIKYLENSIKDIDEMVEKFIKIMDESLLSRDAVKVVGAYANNCSLLRFRN